MHEVTTTICLLISIMAPKYENMTMRLLRCIVFVLCLIVEWYAPVERNPFAKMLFCSEKASKERACEDRHSKSMKYCGHVNDVTIQYLWEGGLWMRGHVKTYAIGRYHGEGRVKRPISWTRLCSKKRCILLPQRSWTLVFKMMPHGTGTVWRCITTNNVASYVAIDRPFESRIHWYRILHTTHWDDTLRWP